MIQPNNKYYIPTVYVQGLQEDTTIQNFIHCYIPEPVPVGRRRLWGIEYPIKPINIRHEDSSDVLLELAMIEPDQRIGERIVSRILFKSSFVLNVYKKMLSIEVLTKSGGVRPVLMIKAYNRDLQKAFTELFALIHGHEGMIENDEGKLELDQRIFRSQSTEQAPYARSLYAQ